MTEPATLNSDGIPVCDGPDVQPRTPRLKTPPGSSDCHAHIFGPVSRYPFSPKRLFTSPDRVVWGSDWPHPAVPGHMPANFIVPNDGDLLDILARWTDEPAQQKRILLDNPHRIYDSD